MRKKLPILEGWRYEVFGRDALALVEGKLAFAVENGKLKMTRVEEEASGETTDAASDEAAPDEALDGE